MLVDILMMMHHIPELMTNSDMILGLCLLDRAICSQITLNFIIDKVVWLLYHWNIYQQGYVRIPTTYDVCLRYKYEQTLPAEGF